LERFSDYRNKEPPFVVVLQHNGYFIIEQPKIDGK